MFPGSRSMPAFAARLLPAALLVLAVALLVGAALVAVAAAAGPSMDGSPAGDLLLAPFRWTPLAERGLA